MRVSNVLAAVGAASFVAAGGFGAAVAISQTGAQTPTKTVTVDVGTGEQGPPGPRGPAGPPGPPGNATCPTDSTFGTVIFNAPGGQTKIHTCIVDK